ncbi:hypothetical protein K3N28_07700 [Glycomyces sp. TRM65418]|uniref:hypothetical protein n=1 Tax=Glycomyces sp. TRM65418 TaxID=2867006 RepID=UPI001CE5CCBA|nr:hypothetical protein [Glycomyces sp. TRM65418]MCC3762955.1 hypothetical protein [Glycomyces sp. TRM65418]QZD56976.1 hypothetical protein K3N28_07650 [Glycomyces sp. TRM65418]
MELWLTLLVIAIVVIALVVRSNRRRAEAELADAAAEARRLHERLGGQTMNLVAPGDNLPAGQALADAGERYTAAGSQLESAASIHQYRLAAETAIEGLHYVRAARTAMGIDPGPEIPALRGQERVGVLTERVSAEVEGRRYSGSPDPDDENRHYYPGGRVDGRPVPAGWYNTPWWKPALAGAAGAFVGLMVFDAMLAPAYAMGAVEGGDVGGGDAGADAGGDTGDGGGDYGDVGGGDFGGGDFGGFE